MATVESWTGDIMAIGPIYPFAGIEGLLVIIGVAFWIIWHIWQWRMEAHNYQDDLRVLQHNDNLAKALRGEKVLRPM